jgi:integrase
MVLLDVTTGLRRSELFALTWSDVDFWNLTININRSIFQVVLGNCKTEASRRPVPLSLDVAADLWLWKERTIYSKPDELLLAISAVFLRIGSITFGVGFVMIPLIESEAVNAHHWLTHQELWGSLAHHFRAVH